MSDRQRVFYRTLGGELRDRRKKARYTQAEMAHEIGVSRASIANIESGRVKLDVLRFYDIVEALRIRSQVTT